MTPEMDELINRHINRLRWKTVRVQAIVILRYAKPNTAALTFEEAMDFVRWLESHTE